MATTEISPGIYRIVVARIGVEPEVLTRHETGVTILPPGAQDDPEQEVVICRCLMSSIVCSSLALLVGNHPWSRAAQHHHLTPLPYQTNLLPYLRRRSRETQGRRPDQRVPS